MVLLGGVILRVKGSSSPQENLDNILTADGQSSLVCLNASGHCAYRQDLFIAVPLSRGSCGIDKIPAFFISSKSNLESFDCINQYFLWDVLKR